MITYQVDTNILLRFLLQDIPEKTAQVAKMFRKAEAGEIVLEISEPVFIEMAVALKNYCKLPKERIIPMLEKILSLSWISLENSQYLRPAALLYSSHGLDFTDCVVLARAMKKSHRIFTFDSKLSLLASSQSNAS